MPNTSQIASMLFLSLLAAALVGASPAKIVPGKAFDRFITIWLENQDYAEALKDSHFLELKKQGISLTRYYAHTHPSQPNYVASIGGDYFGLNNDFWASIPSNVSTVVDLFDWRGLSWKGYFEDIPGPGYMGNASDGQTGNDTWDYVRKHNPFVTYESIAHNGSRLWNLVGFDDFAADLSRRQVPQFAFMTPNMMNDGHNTTLTYSTKWSHHFIEPLLRPDAFDEKTLILLTFDESATYDKPNHIGSLLLGSAVPAALRNTEDATFYTHYSVLSTLEYNWKLPNLGRYDVGANVFACVLGTDEPKNKDPPEVGVVDNSVSYPGFLNNDTALWKPIPPPNLGLTGAGGQPILEKIRLQWVTHYGEETPYDGTGRVYDGVRVPIYGPQPPETTGAGQAGP